MAAVPVETRPVAATGARHAAMRDLAFIIPVRIDTPDRYWNLSVALRFLERHMEGAELVIVEQDGRSHIGDILRAHPAVKHVLHQNEGPFRRAESINVGFMSTQRRFVCMYDADILIAPEAIERSIDEMKRHGWRLVLPFNRVVLDVRGALRQRIGETLEMAGLDRVTRLRDAAGRADVTPRFVEGAIMLADREVFLAEGGLNRHMVSYGWEDTEMHKRFKALGYHVLTLTPYSLIHLDHSRGVDSRPNEHYDANRQVFLKVLGMSPAELADYVCNDLSLTRRGEAAALEALRREQQRLNRRGLLKWRAFLTLLVVNLRAHGALAFIRSRLGRG